MKYRVILFDLFGTLILFRRSVPAMRGAGTQWRSGLEWLRAPVATELPDLPFEEFGRVLRDVTEEIGRERAAEHREVLSRERFHRVLVRVGIPDERAGSLAEAISLAHMRFLAGSTEMPGSHVDLLHRLSARYRMGVVSNFDHGPTAQGLLSHNRIAHLFETKLISAEFGRRKPHPSIFQEAMAQVNADPADCLFVGDSLFDDVGGSIAAGLDVAWINPSGEGPPDSFLKPTFTIPRLTDLPRVLGE